MKINWNEMQRLLYYQQDPNRNGESEQWQHVQRVLDLGMKSKHLVPVKTIKTTKFTYVFPIVYLLTVSQSQISGRFISQKGSNLIKQLTEKLRIRVLSTQSVNLGEDDGMGGSGDLTGAVDAAAGTVDGGGGGFQGGRIDVDFHGL